MLAHDLAALLYAGPNLPVTVDDGPFAGLVEVTKIKSNFDNKNRPIMFREPDKRYSIETQALVIE